MNELKAETIINAGIRIAEKNLTSAYIVKRGDEQAGAIFVKINTLDGFSKLFTRNIKYDLNNDKVIIELADLYPQKRITTKEIDNRISKEIEVDRDCWVVEIEDKNGFNAFEKLDC
tara:strand:- start:334 stop:681 length:348 start_codon:yes stop_codon:yes gene_type:complete